MAKAKPSNVHIVLVAVAQLGGITQSVHTEDIAIDAYKIAPNRFGWRKYPERIDLELVRRSLTTATEKDPPLLTGSVRNGWMLSKDGIRWLENNSEMMDTLTGHRRGSLLDAIEVERMRLRETNAWQKYKAEVLDQIRLSDFFEFVRVNEYFSEAKRQERLNIITNVVDGDAELNQLWQFMSKHFAGEMEKIR